MTPVSRTPALMRDRGNEDVVFSDPVEDGVGKAIEDESALTPPPERVSKRRVEDLIDGVVDLEGERLCRHLASRLVPFTSFGELLSCFAVESKRLHPRRKSFALTSSHGIVSTAPDSISRHLRSASSAQSSSTSGSGGGSRLSMSNPARVARSLSGRSKAALKTSLRSRAMGRFYRERAASARPSRAVAGFRVAGCELPGLGRLGVAARTTRNSQLAVRSRDSGYGSQRRSRRLHRRSREPKPSAP